MRCPASEKLEIIRLVERSHLPIRRTLDKLGIPSTTFYRWYDRYRAFGEVGRADRTSGPGRVWHRIPDEIRRQIVDLALDEPELSPRELAVTFTDTKGYFVSEASVYRLLKAHGLITSPVFVVIKAADACKDRTTAPNQLWQTDFTHLKVVGWGWNSWISEEAVAAWLKSDKRTAGGDPVYADLAIETVLMVRTVFHLPLRQAEGFVAAVFGLMGIDLPVPDHTTLSRRGPGLRVRLPAVPATGTCGDPGRQHRAAGGRGQIGPQRTRSQDSRQAPRLAQAASGHGHRLGPIGRLRTDHLASRRCRRPA